VQSEFSVIFAIPDEHVQSYKIGHTNQRID